MRACALLICMLLTAGCSRQDTECLARIGRKLAERAQARAEEIGGKLALGWKNDTAAKEPAGQP